MHQTSATFVRLSGPGCKLLGLDQINAIFTESDTSSLLVLDVYFKY